MKYRPRSSFRLPYYFQLPSTIHQKQDLQIEWEHLLPESCNEKYGQRKLKQSRTHELMGADVVRKIPLLDTTSLVT